MISAYQPPVAPSCAVQPGRRPLCRERTDIAGRPAAEASASFWSERVFAEHRITGYSNCPQCDNRTKSSTETVIERATKSSSGTARVVEQCAFCSFHHEYTKVLARIQESSSSGGSSSGGSSSFGGGSEARVRATLTLVTHPLGEDRPQMPLIERNEMVVTFAPRCSNQALTKRVRLWDAGRCLQHANIHGPQYVVHGGREHGVAIMNHESVRVVATEEGYELLRCPVGGRVFGRVPMPNPTAADLQHQEDVDEPECCRDGHEEIAGQCLAGVVAQKRAPRLRR